MGHLYIKTLTQSSETISEEGRKDSEPKGKEGQSRNAILITSWYLDTIKSVSILAQ